jgi:hypothetical protein
MRRFLFPTSIGKWPITAALSDDNDDSDDFGEVRALFKRHFPTPVSIQLIEEY